MSCVLFERFNSRAFAKSKSNDSVTGLWIASGSDDVTTVYQAVVIQTPVVLNGLLRESIDCKPLGNSLWDVSINYANIPVEEAIDSASEGGGQEPAEPPASESEPLKSGYSFSTAGGTTHITQSINTISSTAVPPLAAPDHQRAIGVTKNGVEGVDIVTPNMEFSRTVQRRIVTNEYIRTLEKLTGTVNKTPFYGRRDGDVLYLGAEGQFESGGVWSITHRFSVSQTKFDIEISDDITVPKKRGWEYLWVQYKEVRSGGNLVQVPKAAYVEQTYEESDFALLEIGV